MYSRNFSDLADERLVKAAQGDYQIAVEARNGRKKRVAEIEVRYKEVGIRNPKRGDKTAPQGIRLWINEAKETGYSGEDAICWRLLTIVEVKNVQLAMLCIECIAGAGQSGKSLKS